MPKWLVDFLCRHMGCLPVLTACPVCGRSVDRCVRCGKVQWDHACGTAPAEEET